MTDTPQEPCIKTQQELSEIYGRDDWEKRLAACTEENKEEWSRIPSSTSQMRTGTSIVGTHYYETHNGQRTLVAFTLHYRDRDGKLVGKRTPRALLIDGQWCSAKA